MQEYDCEIMKKLETSARCCNSSCQECIDMKNCLKILEDWSIPVHHQSKEEKILMNMFYHMYRPCYLTRCPFYWCDSLPKKISGRQEIIAMMKQRVENYVPDSFLGDAKVKTFVKLQNGYPEYLKEGVDWNILCRLGKSRNTVFVSPAQQDRSKSQDYWVIKKFPLIEEDSQEKLYRSLREIQHPGIVQHLWAVSFEKIDVFAVCTLYEGISLKEIVEVQPIQSLNKVVNLMLQLIEILQHLHQKGILFLNWSGSNIIIDQTSMKVKLADFSASTMKEHVHLDIGDVKAYLPVHLHPPEMLKSNDGHNIDEMSDVWGVGCLLHEMVTGKPIWYQFQHETLIGLQQKMKSNRPLIPSSIKELLVIFNACWEDDREYRPKLEELKQLLLKASNRQKKTVYHHFKCFTNVN